MLMNYELNKVINIFPGWVLCHKTESQKTIIFYTVFLKQQKVLSVSFMLIMGPNM